MECSFAYVVQVETSVSIASSSQLEDALLKYLASSYGNTIMCTYLLDNTHKRALCWLASSNAAFHLIAQPLLHLSGSLSARFTWPIACNTHLFRVIPSSTQKVSLQDVFSTISPDYMAYERNNEVIVRYPGEECRNKVMGCDFQPVAATDIHLLHCSWYGKPLVDMERSILTYNKSFVALLQSCFYLMGIDICLLAMRCTGFSTFCIACATKTDTDLLQQKASKDMVSIGELGKFSIQQVYRGDMEASHAPSIASTVSEVSDYEHFIIWDSEECSIAPEDDIRDLDKRLLFSASSYKDALLGYPVVHRIMFSINMAPSLTPKQLQDLTDLKYKLLFNASLTTVYRELEDLPRRCSQNRTTKPVVILLSGIIMNLLFYLPFTSLFRLE